MTLFLLAGWHGITVFWPLPGTGGTGMPGPVSVLV